jgi:hypothetical protein
MKKKLIMTYTALVQILGYMHMIAQTNPKTFAGRFYFPMAGLWMHLHNTAALYIIKRYPVGVPVDFYRRTDFAQEHDYPTKHFCHMLGNDGSNFRILKRQTKGKMRYYLNGNKAAIMTFLTYIYTNN